MDIFTNFVIIMIIQPHPKLFLRHTIFYDCNKIAIGNFLVPKTNKKRQNRR